MERNYYILLTFNLPTADSDEHNRFNTELERLNWEKIDNVSTAFKKCFIVEEIKIADIIRNDIKKAQDKSEITSDVAYTYMFSLKDAKFELVKFERNPFRAKTIGKK